MEKQIILLSFIAIGCGAGNESSISFNIEAIRKEFQNPSPNQPVLVKPFQVLLKICGMHVDLISKKLPHNEDEYDSEKGKSSELLPRYRLPNPKNHRVQHEPNYNLTEGIEKMPKSKNMTMKSNGQIKEEMKNTTNSSNEKRVLVNAQNTGTFKPPSHPTISTSVNITNHKNRNESEKREETSTESNSKNLSKETTEKMQTPSSNNTTNVTAQNEPLCLVRIEEDDMLKFFPGTYEEAKSLGYTVIDVLCEGDYYPDGDKALSRNALYSLIGGVNAASKPSGKDENKKSKRKN